MTFGSMWKVAAFFFSEVKFYWRDWPWLEMQAEPLWLGSIVAIDGNYYCLTKKLRLNIGSFKLFFESSFSILSMLKSTFELLRAFNDLGLSGSLSAEPIYIFSFAVKSLKKAYSVLFCGLTCEFTSHIGDNSRRRVSGFVSNFLSKLNFILNKFN